MRDTKYRKAVVADVPAIRVLFDEVFPIKYDDKFYKLFTEGLKKGCLADKPGMLVCYVAVRGGDLVGAVVLHTLNVLESRNAKQLAFDIVDGVTPETQVAYILLLGVDRESRRAGIATELVYYGVRALLEATPIAAAFLHTLTNNDSGSNELYSSMHYDKLGIVPEFYTIDGKPRDAFVWAQAFSGHTLQQYQPSPSRPDGLVDLRSPTVAPPPTRRFPKWMVTLFLQFGLPVIVVLLMFAISYALVLFGPLRGIAGRGVVGAPGGGEAGGGGLDEEL